MLLNNFSSGNLNLDPNKGAELRACIVEALKLSLEYNISISFIFNGRQYSVDYENIINEIRYPAEG